MLELGYWLGRPYWGHGFATEGAGRVARYAFEELDEPVLWASYHHDNRASGHVLAKLGAVPAGVEHHHCVARGHAVYCHVVMIDRENFGLRLGRAG
jgi:RimJ/RimL family protein N-acetyltransferase